MYKSNVGSGNILTSAEGALPRMSTANVPSKTGFRLPSPPRPKRYSAKATAHVIILFIAILVAMLAFIGVCVVMPLVRQWLHRSPGVALEPLFAAHALFMSAFLVLATLAVVVQQQQQQDSRNILQQQVIFGNGLDSADQTLRIRRWSRHRGLMSVAVLSAVLGAGFIVANKARMGRPHLKSIHSGFGAATLGALLLQLTYGLYLAATKDRFASTILNDAKRNVHVRRAIHTVTGYTTVVLMWTTAGLGAAQQPEGVKPILVCSIVIACVAVLLLGIRWQSSLSAVKLSIKRASRPTALSSTEMLDAQARLQTGGWVPPAGMSVPRI